jgi:hypothetical protein
MMHPIHERLRSEHEQLTAVLPRLSGFVRRHQFAGDPPTSHRFLLQPFGLHVRGDHDPQPVAFDPERHGPIALVLSADPDRYPWQPWQATALTAPGVAVVSPHVGNSPGARGLVCWLSGPQFEPSAHPLSIALCQALRILAGEVYELEGFALDEESKVYFANHRDALPFARVPELDSYAPLTPLRGDVAAAGDRGSAACVQSALGIRFLTAGGPR